jgi:hypothetical protein
MGRLPRLGISLVGGAGLLLMGLASTAPVSAQATTPTTNASASIGGAYTALTPLRLLDTRATGQTSLGPNGTQILPVVTTADGVPADATAVALNVTSAATDGGVVTTPGYVSVYPTGGTQPLVSNLNFTVGETVPNSVIVPIGTGGDVTFYNHTGTTDVVVDLEGYFAPESGASAAGAYVPLTPARIADTRTASTYPDAGHTLAAGGSLAIQVTGAGGVPAGASGAILNVTVTNTTAASFLTVYPGGTMPTASNLNWAAGGVVANRVLAPLSSTGSVTVYNHTGSADVVVDVNGYFTSSTATAATLPANASLYTAITPIRLVDTRLSGGTLGAAGIYPAQIAGQGGISSAATAGVLNVTATDTTAASFFTVYPAGIATPIISDVNWAAGGATGPPGSTGQVVPNLTVATLSSTGGIDVFNHAGSADLVIDAFGYFTPFVAPVISVTSAKGSVAVGATDVITATVTSSTLAYPDTVQFTTNGAAACGTLSPATGSVSASAGTATSTYTAGATTGTCVITAREASGGNSASTTITQTGAVDTVVVTGTTPIVGNGTSTDTLTATVTGTLTGPASDKVTFTGAGTCGTFSPASGTTAATTAFTVQTIYTSSAASGFCTVTATEANTGQTGTYVIDQTAAGVTALVALTPAVSPATGQVVANGVNTETITVTTTAGGAAYADQVALSTPSGSTTCGTLSPSLVTTNASGTATVTYTTPAEAVGASSPNSCVITGTEAASGNTGTAVVNQKAPVGPPNTITASINPISIPVSTTGPPNYGDTTLTVDTATGTAVAGDVISWTASGICGDWNATPGIGSAGITSSTGTDLITFYSNPVNGACYVTFTEAGTGSTVVVTVNYTGGTSGSLATVTSVTPDVGPAAGATPVTITGTNFGESPGDTTVAFGGVAATDVSVTGGGTITATSPAGAGTVHVTVTNGYGTSATTPADEYTYIPVPVMVSIAGNGTGLVVTYNENVTCAGTAYQDFAWQGLLGATPEAATGCSSAGDVVTLAIPAAAALTTGSGLTYTAATTPTPTTAIYTNTASVPIYAETPQTIT